MSREEWWESIKMSLPVMLNLLSMWCVRLPLSAFAALHFGLVGVWYVMCIELCFRGAMFLSFVKVNSRDVFIRRKLI